MCSPDVMNKVQETMSRRNFLGMMGVGAASIAVPSAVLKPPAAPRLGYRFQSTGNIVDLTHILTPDFPGFPLTAPGTGPAEITVAVTIEKDGFYGNRVSFWEHSGTHMDAPAHFSAGNVTADALDHNLLIAPLAVVDIKERADADADAQLTVDDITAWETAHGKLPAGAFIAMYSGWATKVGSVVNYRNMDSSNVMHFPGFSPEAIDFLLEERDIVGIGVDTMSLDFGASADFKVHVTALSAGKYGVENLANLADVPPSGATVFVGGPKHLNASGGPARVLATY